MHYHLLLSLKPGHDCVSYAQTSFLPWLLTFSPFEEMHAWQTVPVSSSLAQLSVLAKLDRTRNLVLPVCSCSPTAVCKKLRPDSTTGNHEPGHKLGSPLCKYCRFGKKVRPCCTADKPSRRGRSTRCCKTFVSLRNF